MMWAAVCIAVKVDEHGNASYACAEVLPDGDDEQQGPVAGPSVSRRAPAGMQASGQRSSSMQYGGEW